MNLARESAVPLETIRATYLLEVERFAEELRPRFEAGELRANVDADYPERVDPAVPYVTPMDVLEDLCAARFECKGAREGYEDFERGGPAFEAACLIAVVSPSAAEGNTGDDPRYYAAETVALDVLAIARRRGWTR